MCLCIWVEFKSISVPFGEGLEPFLCGDPVLIARPLNFIFALPAVPPISDNAVQCSIPPLWFLSQIQSRIFLFAKEAPQHRFDFTVYTNEHIENQHPFTVQVLLECRDEEIVRLLSLAPSEHFLHIICYYRIRQVPKSFHLHVTAPYPKKSNRDIWPSTSPFFFFGSSGLGSGFGF